LGPAAAEAEAELIRVVEDENEHEMVRHEAAEALGSIDTLKSTEILKKYANSPCRIVRESCEVALDQADYYADSSQFQPISSQT
jgi:deoxyhypusine monooxygenase